MSDLSRPEFHEAEKAREWLEKELWPNGPICPRCAQGLRNLQNISVEALRYLRHFQRSSYAEATKARPSEDVQQEVETLMQGYFTYLLERELNTPGFMKRIKA